MLLREYGQFISDSRIKDVIKKQIEIFDSTTISLFKDILTCVGRKPQNGKEKGGIKMHTVINVDEVVPKMVWFTSAATHDPVSYTPLRAHETPEHLVCRLLLEKNKKQSSVHHT